MTCVVNILREIKSPGPQDSIFSMSKWQRKSSKYTVCRLPFGELLPHIFRLYLVHIADKRERTRAWRKRPQLRDSKPLRIENGKDGECHTKDYVEEVHVGTWIVGGEGRVLI